MERKNDNRVNPNLVAVGHLEYHACGTVPRDAYIYIYISISIYIPIYI